MRYSIARDSISCLDRSSISYRRRAEKWPNRRCRRRNSISISDRIDDADDAIQSRSEDMSFHQLTRQLNVEWAFFIEEMRDRIVEWRNDVFSCSARTEWSHWSDCWNKCLVDRNRLSRAKTRCWFLLYETWSSQIKFLTRRILELVCCRFRIWYLTRLFSCWVQHCWFFAMLWINSCSQLNDLQHHSLLIFL
jgi:hypothetical protein